MGRERPRAGGHIAAPGVATRAECREGGDEGGDKGSTRTEWRARPSAAHKVRIEAKDVRRHIDDRIRLQVDHRAEQRARGGRTAGEQRLEGGQQEESDEALAVATRAHDDGERVEQPCVRTQPCHLLGHLPCQEDVSDLPADDEVGCAEEQLAPRRMKPQVWREQQRKQRRVSIRRPLKWRASTPHERRTVGEDMVVHVRVGHLQVLVVPSSIQQQHSTD